MSRPALQVSLWFTPDRQSCLPELAQFPCSSSAAPALTKELTHSKFETALRSTKAPQDAESFALPRLGRSPLPLMPHLISSLHTPKQASKSGGMQPRELRAGSSRTWPLPVTPDKAPCRPALPSLAPSSDQHKCSTHGPRHHYPGAVVTNCTRLDRSRTKRDSALPLLAPPPTETRDSTHGPRRPTLGPSWQAALALADQGTSKAC